MSGEIILVTGPMGAGKTTELVRLAFRASAIGKRIKMYSYKEDTRYSKDMLTTHNGISSKFPVELVSEMPPAESCAEYDIITIDEAQFIGGVRKFANDLALIGKSVYISCLISDYRRQAFGNFGELCTIASKIEHVTALCQICGKDAMFTKANTVMQDVKKIGGFEAYTPVCRLHYE